MNKYAIILACSKNYLYGLNAVLNSLDYYGNKVDVYVMWFENNLKDYNAIASEFFEKIKTHDLNLNIVFKNVDEVIDEDDMRKSAVWKLKFSRWKFTHFIKNKYKAICHIGADLVMLDNFMEWFEMVEGHDFIISARNVLGNYHFTFPDKPFPTNNVKYADCPCFMDPSMHFGMTDYMYNTAKEHKMGDMPIFNYAIQKLNKRVVLIPNELWLFAQFRTQVMRKTMHEGKLLVMHDILKVPFKMIHNKFWNKARVDDFILKTKEGNLNQNVVNIAVRNLNMIYEIYKFFNTEHKLKLNWIENL